MSHDPARLDEVRAWFAKAKRDLETAAFEKTANFSLTGDISFHSQQAAEKAMKGFLAWHDCPFRKTHNLIELGGLIMDIDSSLESILEQAAPLTEYAWKFRYPGDPEEPSAREAEEAFLISQKLLDELLKRLPKEILDFI